MKSKFVVLTICLSLAACGYLVHSETLEHGEVAPKQVTLDEYLHTIPNWKNVQDHPLLDVILEELKLDDYIHRTFTNGEDMVRLYVGYYYSSKKVGAAHDPMVCFPGQGWEVNNRSQGSDLRVVGREESLSYSTMTVKLGETIELLVYWFQAYDQTTDNTFSQKMKLAGSKLMGNGEDNAFVRISMPCSSRDLGECKNILFDFAGDFYPRFYDFVTSDSL